MNQVCAFLSRSLNWATNLANWISSVLDWLVKIAERLLVLGVAVLAFYFGYYFCRASLSKEQKDSIEFVAENWKIVIILMIPLFYQTVRTFLEEVQEAWGMKRTPKPALSTDPPQSLEVLPAATVTNSPEEE